jgi:hypothetical protein
MSEDRDAFGYKTEPVTVEIVVTAQIAEAKDAATLQPAVVAFFRLAPGNRYIGYSFSPDLADSVADRLHHFAQLAREKHYEES